MLILALDTTLMACSAAIFDSAANSVCAYQSQPMERDHAEAVAGMIEHTASDAGIGLDELERIAVTTGPGTFTGVRIGLAMARGLGAALDIPVVGVSTLAALVANIDDNPDRHPIAVVMDARRNAAYMQIFSAAGEPHGDAKCIAVDQLTEFLPTKPLILTGSGSDLVADNSRLWTRTTGPHIPNAESVARIASELAPEESPPVPLYLRAADAKPQSTSIKLARQSVVITQVGPAFTSVLASIHGECFPAGWSEKEIACLMSSPGVEAHCAATTANGDEPTGFIMLRRAADEAEIITLCVRPSMRRRGAASQLLEGAIPQLKSAGISNLFLEVQAENKAAWALYANAGFTETGRRAGYYKLADGSTADAIIMGLVL